MRYAYSAAMVTAKQIRDARERLKESQIEFGRRFGVDQSTIHRWETNGPPKRGSAKLMIEQFLARDSFNEGAPR
jgi:DNA-binding transcriptional regulator YiaG